MLSHEIDKVLTMATARHTALMQEAAAARLVRQPAQGNTRWHTWQRFIRHWFNRLNLAVRAYQPKHRPLTEA